MKIRILGQDMKELGDILDQTQVFGTRYSERSYQKERGA